MIQSRSPKQPLPERHRDWYPYYAGYTEEFVADLLESFADRAESIVDPWNGSGTTTTVCAVRGLRSTGVDINPTLTVIARARLTPSSIADSLTPLGGEILEAARRYDRDTESDDPLAIWVRQSSVRRVRAIQSAIHSILSFVPDSTDGWQPGPLAKELPILVSFYYTALFATMRDLLMRFRASNPTWLRTPASPQSRIAPGWEAIDRGFLRRVDYLARKLTISGESLSDVDTELITGSATSLPHQTATFGAAITSPPYATRIDYVKGVLPELAVLGAQPDDITRLRRLSTGTPVVKGVSQTAVELASDYGRSVLTSIEQHQSKGSRAYYFPWMRNYLRGLQSGLIETARVVVPGGPICVVAQDSHYKEIHVDLQRIIVDVLAATGRRLVERRDYEVRHHMARLNPRARHYLQDRQNLESVLVFD